MEIEAVGGIGIKVTEEMFAKMIDANWFGDDLEPSDDTFECLERAAEIIGCRLDAGGGFGERGCGSLLSVIG